MRSPKLFTCFGILSSIGHALAAPERAPSNVSLSGFITPDQLYTYLAVPFEVPPEVTSMYVLQSYSFKGAGNSLELGIFDTRGPGPIDSATGQQGLRGWSGPVRSNFTLSPGGATPSYNAGPIEPGTWYIALGPYATNRSGIDWKVDVQFGYDAIDELWTPGVAPMYKSALPFSDVTWLRGDFHIHTIYSDGSYRPEQMLDLAVDQELDFIFFTEHNTDSGNNNIGRYVTERTQDLLIGRGMEVTTRYGHWQALGLERYEQVDWRYTNATDDTGYADSANSVRAAGGIVSINHPYFTCNRCDWQLPMDYNNAMEVWNGFAGWDIADEEAVKLWQSELVKGKKITAIGGSDGHAIGELPGVPTTVVGVLGEKSQASIMQGVKAGRVYIAGKPGVSLEFQVEYDSGKIADMGETAKKDGAVALLSSTGIATGSRACFVSDTGYVQNVTMEEGQVVRQPLGGGKFIRIEIRNSTDGMLAMTNPVWLN